jgi:hypothetical protein
MVTYTYERRQSDADRRAEKFVDLFPLVSENGYWRAVVWRWGGHINGSAQPTKVLDILEGDEVSVRTRVEYEYPGIGYAPEPEFINGLLLP